MKSSSTDDAIFFRGASAFTFVFATVAIADLD
jgi:hypothetical protein